MPAYNFKSRFAKIVKNGRKTQTVRKTDKGATVGMMAHLFTAQRTKLCKKLGIGLINVVCQIEISRLTNGSMCIDFPPSQDLPLSMRFVGINAEFFAKKDGFKSSEEMAKFFEFHYGLPFKGYLHRWKLIK